MPALFGYLVALVLLLGGGYAGLHWLASPDDVGIHQRIGEKPTARNLPKKSEKIEQSEQSESNGGMTAAVPGEADAASGIGTTANAPAAMAAPQQSDHEGKETETVAKSGDKSGDPASGVNDANAAAGGCMPIGVTARGADVFPIQCQALIERQRGSVPSSMPPRTTAAPATVQSSEDAQAKDIAGTPKQGEPRSEPGVKPAQQERRQAKRQERRNLRSSRSGLVMMVLRTIEFPDGHREQQLLPIGRARRMAVEAEDQW
jgi:hypothetical protein